MSGSARRTRGMAILVALVAAAVLLSGAPRAVLAADGNVTIQNFTFTPSPITISAGSSVIWTNQDLSQHQPTANDNSWTTGPLSQSQTGKITFTTPGTFGYFCSIHPSMKGTIVVTAALPDLSAVADGSEVALFGRSPQNQLVMQETAGGSFSGGWVTLLSSGVASRSKAVMAGSNLFVFFRAASNELHYVERTGSTWGSEQNLGGVIAGSPAAAVDGDGDLLVGVLNGAGNVFVDRLPNGGAWTGFSSLDGILSGQLNLTAYNGDVYLFGVNPGQALFYRQWLNASNSWGAWTPLDGVLNSSPAAAVFGGSLYIFAVNPGGVLFYRALSGGAFGAWTTLDGVLSGTPAAAATSTTLLALGTNAAGALFDRRNGGSGWGAWDPLDGVLQSGPEAVALGTQTYAFAINTGGSVFYRLWDGSAFGPWVNLGGVLATEAPVARPAAPNQGVAAGPRTR